MRIKRKWLAVVLAFFMAVLTGCGETAEKPEKEFYSEDGTVSIRLTEGWREKDAAAEGWIGAVSRNGQDAVMVMQSVKEDSFADMEDMKAAVKTVCQISQLEKLDVAEGLPGLKETEAYNCKMNMEGVSGDGYLVYGETDYACYAFIYASKNMNDKTMEYAQAVCGSFQETAPEWAGRPEVEMTDTILWMNGTHAVLTVLNGCDYTIFGDAYADKELIKASQDMLSRQWGITDRESADESLDWLLSKGHRTPFAEEMEELKTEGLDAVPEDGREDFLYENCGMTQDEAERYAQFYKAYREKGEDAISAWDYSRVVMLLSGCYYVGYYEEEEALDRSLEAARMIQMKYDSWDDFTDSYMMGYEYWAEESSEMRRLVYEILLEEPDSPYRLDWNMKLEKSW